MRKKYHEVGLLDVVAGAGKSIEIPPIGTITRILILPLNGGAVPAAVANVTNSIKTMSLDATYEKTGKKDLIVQAIDCTTLYSREIYFAAVTNSEADVLVFDPSASLDVAASTRRYLDLGTADLKRLSLELVGQAALDGVDSASIWVEYEDRSENLGAHVLLGKTTANVLVGGGDVKITDIPKNDDASFQIQRIEIGVPANFAIDYVSVIIDHQNDEMREIPVYLLESLLARKGRKPQAGRLMLDFSCEAFAEFFLPGQMKDFQVIPHFVNSGGGVASQIDVNYELLYI